jgi:hypothetical protein
MEMSGQLHALTAVLPGKELWYPLSRRLGNPQSKDAVEKRKSLSSAVNRTSVPQLYSL